MKIGSEHGSAEMNDFQLVDVETINSSSLIASQRLYFMPFPCGKCQGEIAASCVVGLISHERQNISGQYCQLMIRHAAN